MATALPLMDSVWYKGRASKTSKNHSEEEFAIGFGMPVEQWKGLKPKLIELYDEINPDHEAYKGDLSETKLEHATKVVEQIPSLKRALDREPTWASNAICTRMAYYFGNKVCYEKKKNKRRDKRAEKLQLAQATTLPTDPAAAPFKLLLGGQSRSGTPLPCNADDEEIPKAMLSITEIHTDGREEVHGEEPLIYFWNDWAKLMATLHEYPIPPPTTKPCIYLWPRAKFEMPIRTVTAFHAAIRGMIEDGCTVFHLSTSPPSRINSNKRGASSEPEDSQNRKNHRLEHGNPTSNPDEEAANKAQRKRGPSSSPRDAPDAKRLRSKSPSPSSDEARKKIEADAAEEEQLKQRAAEEEQLKQRAAEEEQLKQRAAEEEQLKQRAAEEERKAAEKKELEAAEEDQLEQPDIHPSTTDETTAPIERTPLTDLQHQQYTMLAEFCKTISPGIVKECIDEFIERLRTQYPPTDPQDVYYLAKGLIFRDHKLRVQDLLGLLPNSIPEDMSYYFSDAFAPSLFDILGESETVRLGYQYLSENSCELYRSSILSIGGPSDKTLFRQFQSGTLPDTCTSLITPHEVAEHHWLLIVLATDKPTSFSVFNFGPPLLDLAVQTLEQKISRIASAVARSPGSAFQNLKTPLIMKLWPLPKYHCKYMRDIGPALMGFLLGLMGGSNQTERNKLTTRISHDWNLEMVTSHMRLACATRIYGFLQAAHSTSRSLTSLFLSPEGTFDDPDEDGENFSGNMFDQIDGQQQATLRRALEHVTEEDIQWAVDYLPFLTKEQMRKNEPISFAKPWGLAEDFKYEPYQIVGFVFPFRTERTYIGGGQVADMPGAGKTVEGLGLGEMNRKHIANVREVKAAWARGDTTRHLPKDDKTSKRCPSFETQPIACWCVADNRTRLFMDKEPLPGLHIFITPKEGLIAFKKDIERMYKDSALMEGKFGSYTPRFAVCAVWDTKAEADAAFCKPLTDDEVCQTCTEADIHMNPPDEEWTETYEKGPKRKREQIEVGGFYTYKKTGNIHALCPNATTASPGDQAAYTTIITTRNCLVSRVQALYTSTVHEIFTPSDDTSEFPPHIHSKSANVLLASRVWWDECHKDSGGEVIKAFIKTCNQKIRKSHPGRHLALWGASGTPDGGHPVRALRFLWNYLVQPEWSEIPKDDEKYTVLATLDEETVKNLESLMAKLEKCRNDDWVVENLPRLYENLHKIVPLFRISRQVTSRWFDGTKVVPINSSCRATYVKLTPSKPEEAFIKNIESQVVNEQNDLHAENLIAWRKNGCKGDRPKKRSAEKTTAFSNAKAGASISPLVKHFLQVPGNDKGSFVQRHPMVNQWSNDPHSDEFTELLEEIQIEQTVKYIETLRLLRGIQHEKRKKCRDRCKVLVAIDDIGTLAVYTNLLTAEFGEESILLCTAQSKNRDKIVQKFEDNDKIWIIIGKMQCVTNSLNLQRANYIILTEPNGSWTNLQQLFNRTCRRGQLESKCRVYILHNTASRLEYRRILKAKREKTMEDAVLDTEMAREDADVTANDSEDDNPPDSDEEFIV